jgi:hypothetical protein
MKTLILIICLILATAAIAQPRQTQRVGEIARFVPIQHIDPGLLALIYGGSIIYGDESLTANSSANSGYNTQNNGYSDGYGSRSSYSY